MNNNQGLTYKANQLANQFQSQETIVALQLPIVSKLPSFREDLGDDTPAALRPVSHDTSVKRVVNAR